MKDIKKYKKNQLLHYLHMDAPKNWVFLGVWHRKPGS